jgi:hypothetical protein
MPVYVLSASGHGYQQEKRRDKTRKEKETSQSGDSSHPPINLNHSSPRPLTLLQNSFSSSLLLPPNNSALPKLLVRPIAALRTIVLLESDPHVILLRKLRLMVLLSDLAPRLLAMSGMRRRASRRLATGNLPLHQLRKSALFVGRELRVGPDLSYYAVGADADDDVAALDRAEAVGDGDGGVVAFEELGEGVVDESLGFGVEGGGRFVEDEDVGVFEQGARDGDALLLPAGELGAAGAGGGVETFGLGEC